MLEARRVIASPPSRRGLVALMVLGMAVACSAAATQVWTRLRVIDYGYQLSQASKENVRLKESNRRLRLELALLKSPSRIAQIATVELGLHPPTPEQIRRLHSPREMPARQALARAGMTRVAP
jgi:cell division protein FtsL